MNPLQNSFKKRNDPIPDLLLLSTAIFLLGFGAILVHSSSFISGIDNSHFWSQIGAIVIGLILMVVIAFINLDFLKKISGILLIINLVFLILVLFPGFHTTNEHSNRWFKLSFLTFQPSEIMKISVIIFLATMLEKKKEKIKDFFKGLLPLLLIVLVICFFIQIEPDFSTAFFVFYLSIVMVFVAGARIKHLILLFLFLLPVLLYLVLSDYRGERVINWFYPNMDPIDGSYHFHRFQEMFSKGGFFGVGLGMGVEKMYIPESHTDSIYAVLAEELGYVGCVGILVLYFIIGYRGYRIALSLDNQFYMLVAFGVTTFIISEGLLNIAIALGLLPITGLPLPLLSYGRTSIITMSIGIGMLLSLSRYAHRKTSSTLFQPRRLTPLNP